MKSLGTKTIHHLSGIFGLIITAILVSGCSTQSQTAQTGTPGKTLLNDSLLETAVIYEANIRQYSPQGTFRAFMRDIPVLKQLGVKILWLMPIHPISKERRKATGDLFVSQIPNPAQRQKYLGSPYAVADYYAINPNLGTEADLHELIRTAHQNGMLVILDWVANHTGWDNPWVKEHPEYYTHNARGEITDPLNPDGTSKGWKDVADLNYDNPRLRNAMTDAMAYWVKKFDIDGFRCDVAGEVPVDFWRQAIHRLRRIKPLFMLAEAWEPELLRDSLFDMCYGWEAHFLLADMAKGRKTVEDWDNYIRKIDTLYEPDDMLMYFTSNHDENSWKGTVYETFGDAWELAAALTYTVKGMPLLYSGQEYGLAHRLKFFEKDSIPKKRGREFELYRKLGRLKNTYPALHGGKHPADYIRLGCTNPNILVFERKKGGKRLIFAGNFSGQTQTFRVQTTGKFHDAFTGQEIDFDPQMEINLKPWNYRLWIQ